MSQAITAETNLVPGFDVYGPDAAVEQSRRMHEDAGKAGGVVLAAVAAVAALGIGLQIGHNASETDPVNAEGNFVPAAENTETCPDTWEIAQLDHGSENRVLPDGLASLGEAQNRRQAQAAFVEYVDIIKQDPETFSGVSSAVLGRNIPANALVAEGGECASPAAERVEAELVTEAFIGGVSPENPGADMLNSGTNAQGELVAGAVPGITGSLEGITFMVNGKLFGLLERCGNPTFARNPGLPEGPNDNPTPPTTTTIDNKHPVPIVGGGPPDPIGPPTGPVIDNPNQYNPTTSTTTTTTQPGPVTTTTRPTTNPSTTTSVVPPTTQPRPPQG